MNENILIVDDEPDILEFIKSILENHEFSVKCAQSGEEAIKYFRIEPFALVITDIKMPKMDGFELIKQVKKLDSETEIIFMTGFPTIDNALAALKNFGAFDFFTKPLKDIEQLVVTINKALERRRLLIENKELVTALSQAKDDLERRVKDRTAELEKLNEQLRSEIVERRQAENALTMSLREKEVLLREIHHRVKNNMQVISSLLKLQSESVKDEKYVQFFKESQNRIRSMSLVHEKLYLSENMAEIDFKEYIREMVNSLLYSYGVGPSNIAVNMDIENISLEIETAVPLGLVINELVSNSIKHAFSEDRKGKIKITLFTIAENEFELTVKDNGKGIPKDLDFRKTESLGLQLVTDLAELQLEGKISLNRTDGTEFQIRFKDIRYEKRI